MDHFKAAYQRQLPTGRPTPAGPLPEETGQNGFPHPLCLPLCFEARVLPQKICLSLPV